MSESDFPMTISEAKAFREQHSPHHKAIADQIAANVINQFKKSLKSWLLSGQLIELDVTIILDETSETPYPSVLTLVREWVENVEYLKWLYGGYHKVTKMDTVSDAVYTYEFKVRLLGKKFVTSS